MLSSAEVSYLGQIESMLCQALNLKAHTHPGSDLSPEQGRAACIGMDDTKVTTYTTGAL